MLFFIVEKYFPPDKKIMCNVVRCIYSIPLAMDLRTCLFDAIVQGNENAVLHVLYLSGYNGYLKIKRLILPNTLKFRKCCFRQ